jgi:NAD(P)-dependent dehydrogenase (short-subunit alcohol dehydrogenase family)
MTPAEGFDDTPRRRNPRQGPVVLVTGCSSGIGLATAVRFAASGCRVVATMRNLDRSGPLRDALVVADTTADVRVLDIADDDTVTAVIDAIIADYGGIDVVVSNAGIGIDGTVEELTVDDFRATFETNVLGSVRLLHALMPGWRAKGAGRFIAISSTAGVVGAPFNDAYSASKFALEGMLESLHPIAASFGVAVSVVEPGPVSGEFAGRHGPPASRTPDGPYTAIRARFAEVQKLGYVNAQTNDDVAAVLWQVATADAPVFRYQTSENVQKLVSRKLVDLTGERVTGMLRRWI